MLQTPNMHSMQRTNPIYSMQVGISKVHWLPVHYDMQLIPAVKEENIRMDSDGDDSDKYIVHCRSPWTSYCT